MKIINENGVHSDVKYIAVDGVEFKTELACIKYEKNLNKNDLWIKVQNIECCENARGFYPFDGNEYRECQESNWYRPRTREEADILKEYYGFEYNISDREIGDWVCIEEREDGCYWAVPIGYCFRYVKTLLSILGYDTNLYYKQELNN